MLLPLLPANAAQLAKKTKYSQHTIHKFIYALMKQGKVISLSMPRTKPIYERK
jgi:cyclophilin family peptidyl-prolyl cis-trans isomerase